MKSLDDLLNESVNWQDRSAIYMNTQTPANVYFTGRQDQLKTVRTILSTHSYYFLSDTELKKKTDEVAIKVFNNSKRIVLSYFLERIKVLGNLDEVRKEMEGQLI